MTIVRFSRPYGTRAIGSHFEPQDDVLGYVQTVPTARREPAEPVTNVTNPCPTYWDRPYPYSMR